MIQDQLVEVYLRDLPVDLWKRASAHHEAIQRELEIMRGSQPLDSVPNRLANLIESFDARFGDVGDPAWMELQAAADRGEETIDLTVRVPEPVSGAALQLGSMLEEVDEYCRAGDHLMTLATPPDLVAFREWFLDEFTRQIEGGAEPLPWDENRTRSDRSPKAADGAPNAGRGTETIVFEGSLDLATAGELRDSIQALRAHDPSEIVVDLTNVGFVDSIGIGLLVTTHSRLEEDGVRLRLVVPSRLKELLRLSGLIELLQPEDAPES